MMKKLLYPLAVCISVVFSLGAQPDGMYVLDEQTEIVKEIKQSHDFEWIDFDNDGDLDLFVTNENWGSSLFVNNSGDFTRLSDGVLSSSTGMNKGTWADYDNDGYLDLYQIRYPTNDGNRLFRNKGDGVFEVIKTGPIVSDRAHSQTCEWADYDGDGDMDMYVGNGDLTYEGFRNNLYINYDGSYFGKLSMLGFVEDYGSTVQTQWLDMDNDTDLDLFVANTGHKSAFYIQKSPGSFEKPVPLPYDYRGVDGIGWTDYNNDGFPDGLVVDRYAALLMMNPDMTIDYRELPITIEDYVDGTVWGDYDNDGDNDLLMYSGYRIRLLRNEGNYLFIDVPLPGFNADGAISCAKFVDQDLDGDLDIYASRYNYASEGAMNLSFKNAGNSNNWLLVKLSGSYPNHSTDHAKIVLYVNDTLIRKYNFDSFAKGEANSMYFHIGIGGADQVDSIVVKWGSGIYQTIRNVPVNQLALINEPNPHLPVQASSFTASATTYRTIILQWKDETDLESHYVIERKKSGETVFEPVAKLQRNVKVYVDSGLVPETAYEYKVYAINKGGASEALFASAITLTPPPAPNAPQEVKATPSAFQVSLTWTDASDNETGFVVERSDTYPEHYVKIAETSANDSFFIDQTVQPNVAYYYRVAASNDGVLSYSNTIEVNTDFVYFHKGLKFSDKLTNHLDFLDYNGDNNTDLLFVGSRNKKSRIIYRDLQTPSYDSTEILLTESPYTSIRTTICDINKDNEPDILYVYDGKIRIEKSGSGEIIDVPTGTMNFNNIYFTDLDQDGRNEIITFGWGINQYNYSEGQIVYKGSIWGENMSIYDLVFWDFDGDSDQDILVFYWDISGYSSYKAGILVNTNSQFELKDLSIDHPVEKVVPADYNNDGHVDLMIIGPQNYNPSNIYIYKNNGRGDYQLSASLPYGSNAVWTDYDSDGDLDVLIINIPAGYNIYSTAFFENKGDDIFADAKMEWQVDAPHKNALAVGDYDFDGDVDIAISQSYSPYFFQLYRNVAAEQKGAINSAPETPSGLKTVIDFNVAVLTWDKSVDRETPQDGLTYNLFLKQKDSENYLISPLSDLSNGFRKINARGNAGSSASFSIGCLQEGAYSWSVQCIDPQNRASTFAPSHEFVIEGINPVAPAEFAAKTLSNNHIELTWKDITDNETGYIVKRKKNLEKDYLSIDTLQANSESYHDYDLEPDSAYEYQVVAFNCSASDASEPVVAHTFPEHFAPVQDLNITAKGSRAVFGDYDNDGDLDAILTIQSTASGGFQAKVFQNNHSVYEEIDITIDGKNSSWVDFDHDGFLDISSLISPDFEPAVLKIYINNRNGSFNQPVNHELSIFNTDAYGPVWADFDNDGDYDALVHGSRDSWMSTATINMLENRAGVFKLKESFINGIIKSRYPWADFDNDGYQDFAAVERVGDEYQLAIYRNMRNTSFSRASIGYHVGLNGDNLNRVGDMAWGDYNGDGYLDLIIAGQHMNASGTGIIRVYKNDRGISFTAVQLDNWNYSSNITVKWGDVDNDGDLDILVYGSKEAAEDATENIKIFYNTGGDTFMESNYAYFDAFSSEGSFDVADYDWDGDLDILHLGKDQEQQIPRVVMFSNNYADQWHRTNYMPETPSGLKESILDSRVTLLWDMVADDLSHSLSYNVVLEKEGRMVAPPNALDDGRRTVAGLGNAGMNNFFIIKNLKKGTYRWAVQAIDNNFQGSAFSQFREFTLTEDIITEIPGMQKIDCGVKVYPNPAKDFLSVELPMQSSYGRLVLMSLDGRVIDEMNFSKGGIMKLDIRKYEKGIKLLKIEDENGCYVFKTIFE